MGLGRIGTETEIEVFLEKKHIPKERLSCLLKFRLKAPICFIIK